MPTTLPIPEFEVKERTTTRITGVLTADDMVTPVPGSTLTTFTITVYALDVAQTVVVTARNVLNVNNGTVDEAGNAVVILSPDDMALVNAALPAERHIALLAWTWGVAPVKTGRQELALIVRNLAKVP